MIYHEIKGSLFDVGPEYFLVHCISADFKMGAGIAKTFADLGCREELFRLYPDYNWNVDPHALWTHLSYLPGSKGAIHLVTKERYFHKPTYLSLKIALEDMTHECLRMDNDIKLAMPKIGCGLDKLEWDKVKEIIFDVFDNTDVEILVCSLK
jgi:hypothetical protein